MYTPYSSLATVCGQSLIVSVVNETAKTIVIWHQPTRTEAPFWCINSRVNELMRIYCGFEAHAKHRQSALVSWCVWAEVSASRWK